MTPRELEEYRALRATIRERGTTRVWVALAGFIAWAAVEIATGALASPPIATFVPLLVLVVTFEIVFALHTAVERIGRYLQVFYEDEATGPGWEHRVVAFSAFSGARMPGAGDPLLAACFWIATTLNLIPAAVMVPVPIEWIVVGAGHAGFLTRVWFARRRAVGQRARDLERFQQIRDASVIPAPTQSSAAGRSASPSTSPSYRTTP